MSSNSQMPPRRKPVARKAGPSQLDRIEAKLDALLSVLAEEDDEEELQYDLDGIAQPAQRNPLEPL